MLFIVIKKLRSFNLRKKGLNYRFKAYIFVGTQQRFIIITDVITDVGHLKLLFTCFLTSRVIVLGLRPSLLAILVNFS